MHFGGQVKSQINNMFTRRPLLIFSFISLILIAAMVIANGYTQSKYFEDALIDREAQIVNQMVVALVQHELRAEDFDNYADASSQSRFARSLTALKDVPGVVRIKIYNSNNVIVWADANDLVGKFLPKTDEHLARVWSGIPSGIFDPAKRLSHSKDPLPNIPLVEFYVPIKVKGAAGREIKAVVAVYRSAKELTETLRHSMQLRWLVSGIAGSLLFLALFYLFNWIYRRKREVENRFDQISTERERAEEDAIRARAKFDTLFDLIADAVLIVGMNGRFIHVNSSACARLGYSYEEMLQMSPADIDTPEYAAKVPERIKIVLEEGRLVFETIHVCKDGTAIPVELNSRLISFGGETAIMSVARDITDRKRVEGMLHQAKEAAELALSEQRQLVAMISHEYRSPLAVIDSAAQLLSAKLSLENDTAPVIARIRRGIFRLTHFLDNCLIEGRMDGDALRLKFSSIDLGNFVESIVETARTISENHRFVIELPSGFTMIDADSHLLSVMLHNLVGNAIKYSPAGSEIILRIKPAGQAISFEVIDQGAGIPADELPLVLRKYMRGRAVAAIPGAGLGLSLVDKIITMHGGSLEIKSREGEGTHVTVVIPLRFASNLEEHLQSS